MRTQMNECCTDLSQATTERIAQLESRLNYILSDDNPYFKTIGTEEERIEDADWTVDTINRLKQIDFTRGCKCK